MESSGTLRARLRAAADPIRAEVVLGWRLAARHPVPRAAFGWAIALAALTRMLLGPSSEAVTPVLAGLAGLIAAAAGPRCFVRGGPFESLRWIGLSPGTAVVGRLAGAVVFACVGATAAAGVVAGPSAVGPAALAAAAVHAAIVSALAAALAPSLGCTAATLLPLVLVAVGVGAPYATFVFDADPPPVLLPPPGIPAVGVLGGQVATHAPRLLAWLALAALGVVRLGRQVRAPPRQPSQASQNTPAVMCQRLTCADPRTGQSGHGLDQVTLTAESGEIVAVMGVPPEGPGVFLRVVAGLEPLSGGFVSIRRERPRAARGFGYVRAGLTGPADLTAMEWLRYVADHVGGPARARAMRAQAAVALVGLGADAGCRIGHLDRGAVERLAVATCAVSGAAVVLLDDCFVGVHATTRQVLTDALADLAAQGRTVLLAPRDVRAAETVATRVVVLRDGRVLADLRMTTVQQERVAELQLNGGGLAAISRITAHFPDAVRTGTGVDVPLRGGRTLEAVLALCRSERIPILGSRVRYRAVDDLLGPGRTAPDPARVAVFG